MQTIAFDGAVFRADRAHGLFPDPRQNGGDDLVANEIAIRPHPGQDWRCSGDQALLLRETDDGCYAHDGQAARPRFSQFDGVRAR